MEAPQSKVNPEEFNRIIDAHVIANYEAVGDGYKCKRCDSIVQQTSGYASIHATEFGDSCAGSGEVRKFPLPYCSKCEGEPKRVSTCVHIPFIPVSFLRAEK